MKISVITPSFNSSKYIERAIQSVLAQAYDNYEHIVVDGRSKDETVEILKRYSHIRWISEADKGQSDAMNKGFKMATGDIIVYLNADDEFENGIFLEVQKFFVQHPECDMIIGKLRFIFSNQVFVRTPSTHFKDIVDFSKDLFPANPVSYFYKREVQDEIGEFPIKEHYTMDYWFLLHVYKRYNVQLLPIIFGNFYFDGYNKTATSNVRKNLKKALRSYLIRHDIFLYIKKFILLPFYFQIRCCFKKLAK